MMHKDVTPGSVVLMKISIPCFSGAWVPSVTIPVVVAEKVARVTSTQAVTDTGIRFRLDDGKIIGGSGSILPVGWVAPYASSAAGKRPLQATPESYIQQVRLLAENISAMSTELEALRKDQSALLRQLISDHGPTVATAEVKAVTEAMRRLTQGFKS